MTNAWQALRWLDSGWLPQISQALVHFLWQGLAIAILYAVVTRCLRGSSANTRYSAGVAALLLMAACLPLTLCMLPAPVVVDRDSPTSSVDIHETLANMPLGDFATEMPPREMHMPAAPMKSEPTVSKPVMPEIAEKSGRTWEYAIEKAKAILASSSPFIIAFYFCGVGLMMLRVTFGLWGGHRLRRDSTPCVDAAILRTVAEHARRMAMRVAPAVAYCRRVSTPLVVGVLHPMILLPTGLMSSLSAEQIEAVLVHELAHIRRFDLAINILQRLIEAILFFHPAVWWVSRRISRERENCCDDFVLRSGWQRADYASALVSIAEICSTGRIRAAALGVSSNGNSEFKRRIIRLLLIKQEPRVRLLRTGTLALTFLLTLTLSASVVMVSRLMAQSNTPINSKQTTDDRKSETVNPQASSKESPKGEKPKTAVAAGDQQPPETVTFDGACVDSDKHWVADVEVTLFEVVSGVSQKLLQKRQTNAKGKFAFDPVPLLQEDGPAQSHYAIVAAKKGKATVVVENLRHSKSNTRGLERLELSMLEPGVVEGRITDTDGKPVAGAQVYPGSWQRMPVGLEWGTTTDSDGNYRITDYPKFDGSVVQQLGSEGVGTYKLSLEVRHPNFLRASLPFSKAPAKINAKLQRGAAIEGLVLDDVTGKPAEGVILMATGTFPFVSDWSQAITDANGRYRLSALKMNNCALTVLSKDRTMYAIDRIQTKIGEISKAPDIHLIQGGLIEGRLLDAMTGLPISPDPVDEMGIGLYGPSWPRNFPKRGVCSVLADGSFRLRAAAGSNSLYLTGAGPWQFALDSTIKENVLRIEVAEGQTLKIDIKVQRKMHAKEANAKSTTKKDFPPDNLHLELRDVAGTVLLPDGKPAVGAKLAICSNQHDVDVNEGKLGERYRGKNGDVAESAANGEFKMSGRVGQWILVAVHDGGYTEVEDVEFAKSSIVKLKAWGRIEGVCAFNGKPTAGITIDVGGGRGSNHGIISTHQTVITDAAGKFTVERVPPIRLTVQPTFRSGDINFDPTWYGGKVTVAPGETTRITVPREGHPIAGRVVLPPNSGLKLEDFAIVANIYLRTPHIGMPGDEDLWKGYREFMKSEYGKAFKRDNIPVNADGTFRIEGMPETNYIIQIQAKPKTTPTDDNQDWYYGFSVKRIEIPPRDETPEEVDVGKLQLRVNKIPRSETQEEAVDPDEFPLRVEKQERPNPPQTEKIIPSAAEDDFSKEMKRLEELNANEVGRDVIVAGYEELLKKYPHHPERAEAMLNLAGLWGITIPERQIKADEEKLIAWVRRAREAAVKGSADWLDAQFLLAARVREKNSGEARHLLEEIVQFKPGPIPETQALCYLQEVALFENKFEEAEKICNRLQEWPDDSDRMPEKMFDKGQVYFNMQISASSIMDHWMSHLPRAESEKKLHEFVEKYPTDHNQRKLERMLNLPPGMWTMQLVPYQSTTEEKTERGTEKAKGDEPPK